MSDNCCEITLEVAQFVVELEAEEIEVVVSALGEKGDKGDDGAAGATLAVTKIADGTLSGHRIVRNVDATRVGYVDASDATNGDDVLGLTTQAASDGDPIEVLVEGELTEPGWSWTPLELIYVTGLGLLTQTPPDDMAFMLPVGYAISATAMRVCIRDTIYL